MELFILKKNKIQEVKIKPFKLEKDIQTLIEDNTETLFDIEFIETELTIGKYRVDSLCYDNESNSFIIIEYKKGSSYSVIDQGYTYLQLMLNNKSDFVLALSKHLNKVIDAKSIDWSQSKIIFISQSFNSYQKDSVNFKNLPFELYEIKRFNNNTIVLNQHLSSSNESIDLLSNKKGSSIVNSVGKEVKVYSEEEFLSKVKNPIAVQHYNSLKEGLFNELDIKINVAKHYISFKTQSNKTVCYINFRGNNFVFDIIRGVLRPGKKYNQGYKSKNFFTIDDPKKLSIERTSKFKSGALQPGYRFNIKFSDFDVDYMKFLIKQKYNSIIS